MNVEISKFSAPETPITVSEMSNIISSDISDMMYISGIETISLIKYQIGIASRLHVSIAPFNDAPDSIKTIGIIVKDAIAQIMSIANIAKIHITPSEKEMNDIKDLWAESDKTARSVNVGSGQDFKEKDNVDDKSDGEIKMEIG